MFNLDVTQRCLIAECWCPVEDLDQIQGALTRGTVREGGREGGREGQRKGGRVVRKWMDRWKEGGREGGKGGRGKKVRNVERM